MKFLNKQFYSLPYYFLALLFGYIGFTLTPLLSHEHFFYNLEPYPDSFTYVMPPYNAAQGGDYVLKYQRSESMPNILSSYSLFLFLGFLTWGDPRIIIITNCLLGVFSLYFLYKITSYFSFPHWLRVLALLTYLLHGTVLWLPGLPLTENIVLASSLGSILGALLLRKSSETITLVFFLIPVSLLFFAKTSAVPIAIIVWLVVLTYSYVQKRKHHTTVLLLSAVTTILITYKLNQWIQLDPSMIFNSLTGDSVLNKYYSLSFIGKNLTFYLYALLGKSTTLLWLNQPFTSLLLFALAALGMQRLVLQKKWYELLILGGVFLGTFIAPLIFYHQDSRYVVISIPVLIILCCYSIHFYAKKGLNTIVIIGVVIGSTLLMHASFLKFLVGQNILFNSKPWQYESVLEIDAVVPSDSLVITALPPYLFEIYRPNASYSLLPLSTSQEYISKSRNAWGTEINADDLVGEYTTFAKKNRLYISNAYITHQQSVVADYEAYKEVFDFELIAEGCLSACNIYKLTPKSPSEN